MTSETTNTASNTTTSSTSTGSKTLSLLGIAACCTGAGIAALPHVSYTAAQWISGLGVHGAIGASVCTGGALLVALGRTRKSLEEAQAQAANNSNTTLLLEQLATDLAQTRATLELVQGQAAESTQCVQALRAELASTRSTSDSGSSTEALFQLASGLDKLGARIDQKLKVHHSSLHDSLEELGATLAHTRRTLEERIATLETTGLATLGTTSTTGTTAATTNTAPAANLEADTTLELADQGWNPREWNTPQVPACDETGTLGELENWSDTATGTPVGSLGLLDSFEDTHVAPALPQGEAMACDEACDATCDATLDFDALDANSDELARELDRASRIGQQLGETSTSTTNATTNAATTPAASIDTVPGVADLANKLQSLQALLADPALAALLAQGKTR